MEESLRYYRSSHNLTQCGQVVDNQFRSRWFRGLGSDMEWLRLTLDASGPLQVRVFVSNTPDALDACVPVLERTANDLLLYGVRGHYLAFSVELNHKLEGFTLFFPGRSIVEGLPFVLQDDDTLRTLLGVYQSGYMDLNQEMRQVVLRLNPASQDVLPQLPRWLGARRWSMEPNIQQKILPKAHLLARLRGTRRGLQLLARLITEYPCQILDKQLPQGADTSSPQISILLLSKVSAEDARQLRSLLPDFIPLGVSYTLIHLKEGTPMDGHCYLDENAVLTQRSICRLDGPECEEVILE